jgi:hypothetical protein
MPKKAVGSSADAVGEIIKVLNRDKGKILSIQYVVLRKTARNGAFSSSSGCYSETGGQALTMLQVAFNEFVRNTGCDPEMLAGTLLNAHAPSQTEEVN